MIRMSMITMNDNNWNIGTLEHSTFNQHQSASCNINRIDSERNPSQLAAGEGCTIIWYCMVLHGVELYFMALYDTELYCILWYGIA